MADLTPGPERARVALELFLAIIEKNMMFTGDGPEAAKRQFALYAQCMQAVQGRAVDLTKIT